MTQTTPFVAIAHGAGKIAGSANRALDAAYGYAIAVSMLLIGFAVGSQHLHGRFAVPRALAACAFGSGFAIFSMTLLTLLMASSGNIGRISHTRSERVGMWMAHAIVSLLLLPIAVFGFYVAVHAASL